MRIFETRGYPCGHPRRVLYRLPRAARILLSTTGLSTSSSSPLVYPFGRHPYTLSELKARTVRPLSSASPLPLFVRLSIQLCMSNSDTCRCVIAFPLRHREKAREPILVRELTFRRHFFQTLIALFDYFDRMTRDVEQNSISYFIFLVSLYEALSFAQENAEFIPCFLRNTLSSLRKPTLLHFFKCDSFLFFSLF